MAIVLYRKGNTHVVNGIECEEGRFHAKRMQQLLASGWTGNINDLAEDKVEDVPEVPTKEEADTNESGKLSSKEIRAAAEKAGIEGWETKRIATLEAQLWPTSNQTS